jgi:outer membrane protein
LLLKLEKSKALPSLGAKVNFGYQHLWKSISIFNQDQKWFNYSNIAIGFKRSYF